MSDSEQTGDVLQAICDHAFVTIAPDGVECVICGRRAASIKQLLQDSLEDARKRVKAQQTRRRVRLGRI